MLQKKDGTLPGMKSLSRKKEVMGIIEHSLCGRHCSRTICVQHKNSLFALNGNTEQG